MRYAVLVAVALVALLAGTAIGYYVVPDDSAASAECIVLQRDLERMTYNYREGERRGDPDAQDIVDRYNEECR